MSTDADVDSRVHFSEKLVMLNMFGITTVIGGFMQLSENDAVGTTCERTF